MDNTFFTNLEASIPRNGVRTRFAPSPTGYMHVGGLRTALYAYLLAKRNGGTFILRIEDTDMARYVEGATEVIIKTLLESGLIYDEGPDVGGPAGPYTQSERKEIYKHYADLLVEKGAAYHDEGAIRMRMPTEGTTTVHDMIFGEITVQNDTLDDMVLLKSDGMPTYNFANVVDDHLMGITHVMRGDEYLASAPKYNLLYEAFGWEIPQYVTVSQIMRDAQHKFSKRHGDPTYDDLLQRGYLKEAVLNYVALLGWSPGGEREIFTLPELVEVFDISGISKSGAIFDHDKLKHFNSEYIKAMTPEAFAELARPYIDQAVKTADISRTAIAEILQPRCEVLSDIPEKIGFFNQLPNYSTELYVHKKSKTDEQVSLDMLKAVLTPLETIVWTTDAMSSALTDLATELGVKNATVMWPLRIAVSGQTVTPGGAVELCWILGRDETLRRIRLGIAMLER